ncbi:MAG: type IV secretion system DNA-binding domain-containing protein [Candidatus Pacebacteria bacterium]|jgi:hypothetical protein|nr:type IV secretion system DNA-binding domain-containing protein [Candidatus Paceibacterota bacterium]|tara:strand:+ start:7251 stop:8993 length:1743 start_codon:yes stop_codon:yes gene_type:complete
MNEERITYFGFTDSRGKKRKFGIKAKDRIKHVYTIGKTGMGKSVLLENMAIQDIQNGEGLAFFDPHGSSAETLLEHIPEERLKDVLYFAPFDLERPISFNVMENVDPDKRYLVVNGLMSIFERIWEDAWSARMAYILNNTILALLEYPGATLLGINRVMSDKDYRKKVVDNIKDPSVKSFWVKEFSSYSDRYTVEATAAIQNKVGQFISDPLIRNIIGQPKSVFDLREMMDTRKIFIANLSKGRVGESSANLLGSMLITKIYLAAMSRAETTSATMKNLPNFYLYVDEFQSFANKSFADILSESRKYKLNLTIAHQYIEQMPEEVRSAVFGNVGTMISFRVGAIDAEILEKEFAPTFTAEDLVNLGLIQVYLKLMIDGISSVPFSATTLPPFKPIHASFKEKVITFSREHYGKPRSLIEENINQWYEPVAPPPKPKITPQKTFQKPVQNKNYSTSPVRKQYHQPAQPEKTISLNELKTPPKMIPKIRKEPSRKNREELRSALTSVMKDKNKGVGEESSKSSSYKPFDKTHGKPFNTRPNLSSTENSQNKTQKTQNTSDTKEVPEDVLKKMLDVEDKDKRS